MQWKAASALVLVSIFVNIAAAGPAAAHTGSHLESTNYSTVVRSFDGADQGLSVRSVAMGARLELSNNTTTDAIVLGYENEPYLRVGPAGTFVNTNSPAYYLNQGLDADRPVPEGLRPDAAPDWQMQTSDQWAAWHDHRSHWMGKLAPPAVTQQPDARHVVIADWVVPIEWGQETLQARGDVVYQPPPPAWIGWVASVALALVVAGLTWRWPSIMFRWVPVTLALVYGAFVVANVMVPSGLGGPNAVSAAIEALVAPAVVAAIAGTALLAWRRGRQDAVWLGLFAALVVAVAGGLGSADFLSQSFLPTELPATLAWLMVVVMIGAGFGYSGATAWRLRTQRASLAPTAGSAS